MLRIGKLTDYAILILGQLAQGDKTHLSAPAIADQLRLNVPTVSKILKMLNDANLVMSYRGAEGGYSLIKAAHEIRLSDVITVMEGQFAITQCCDKEDACVIDPVCTMRDNWQHINANLSAVLSNYTLADMLSPHLIRGSDKYTNEEISS